LQRIAKMPVSQSVMLPEVKRRGKTV